MAAEVLRYVQAALADEAGCADAHAAALATLCDALAFTHPDVLLAAVDVAYFAARLPAFLAAGQNDLPVFAARAIAEAVDILPQWAAVFLQHGAVEALRDRLLAADNIELAEEVQNNRKFIWWWYYYYLLTPSGFLCPGRQCLRALDEISQECPDECLRLGVAAAALHLFDFLSASKQKMALKIVTQLVQECDDADVPKAMEAAPALCNLLQSSDNSILGSALSCLGMLAADAHGKAEHMDRLCESKVVDTAMGLLDKDGWKILDDDTLPGILALLKHIASVSEKAVNSLFDLGVCDLLKQMITCYSCSPSGSDKLEMLVELLYQLMQPLGTSGQMNDTTEQNAHVDQLASIVTLITQVAKCGALSSVCYRCVVVIGNIVELSTPTFLVGLQKTANLSSFLTCMLARKNRHIVFQTLEVSKTLLKKHHQFFFESFTKEGVKHAIGTIQAQEKNRNSSERLKRKNNTQEWCMCFDLDLDSSSTDGCKIENNAILNLAEEIKKSFVVVKANKKSPHRFGCVIKFVRDFFARLNRHALTVLTQDPDLCKELSDISRKFLSDELPSTSTFAFAKSGSAKYLVDYLSNRAYLKSNLNNCEDLTEQLKEVQHRLQKFTHLALKVSNGSSVKPLGILVDKLLDALHMSYESFPVILSDHGQRTRESTMIPLRHSRTQESESLDIKFVKARREKVLRSYGGVLPVSLSSKPGEMEAILWPVICSKGNAQGSSRLMFSYKGTKLQPSATIFESLVRLMNAGQSDIVIDSSFWDEEYRISYNRNKSENIPSTSSCNTRLFAVQEKLEQSIVKDPFFCSLFLGKLPGDVDESDPSYDLLFTLKVLEGLNRFSYQLSMDQQICKFAEGYLQNLDDLKVTISPIPQHQFMSNLLTNKLELQMQERLFEDGLVPSWCVYLAETCPFLLSFSARWKYFCLTVHRSFMGDETSIPDGSSTPDEESAAPDEEEEESDAQNEASKKTRKHKVTRDNILESAASMMTKHGSSTKTIEVVFVGEVGTGRGPTFEFYSTVSHELQRLGIGMWRGDNNARKAGEAGFVRSSFGLFPQPWSSVGTSTRGIELSDVVKKFKLLGHVVARALLDGRILDIPLSKAFYKIMLGQELDIYDIPSFDPELGKTVLEFQALVKRKKFLEKSSEKTPNRNADLSYKNVRLEDLCLDFTLPGNPDYELVPGGSEKIVTLENLEEYVNLIVDATLKSGIVKQVEAFKSAVNEVFALKTLRMFDEEEMERILCGEQDSWASSKLEDHIEFEHGYDASSPPIKSFLEILREFEREDQRAFLQFTTGAPQLPLGGLASLDPKLTVVRKQCDGNIDNELPSVNTCRHFIKLPPYSSKEIMLMKLKYALAEGLGSFHLS
ncbi:E3 ubiquitin-protein ligase UPL4-like [Hordeum vulgare subsp. vulgare]|uniref:E3 ubiquitin-protein ligase UPL4-like n=1 Tax=Hordeum vulgare subsp. vulgare TaxID=112509 RepID=UPI001D1A473E|nr:E3 ubiquitin-protein ligase UPL4-like [Hordeum vulgare subsp. vulgare]